MPQKPPISEIEFLKKTQNYREFEGKVALLGINAPILLEYGKHICECWFRLAEEHLVDAKAALAADLPRTVYSRSYYAAYNASKALRYLAAGYVSLRGDDHQASVNLPDDFPDVADWSLRITKLQEHRLRADYDNWSTTQNSHTLLPDDTVALASAFLDEVRSYVSAKFGAFL